MSENRYIKDHAQEKSLFMSRIIISSLVGLFFIFVIIIRLVQLQIVEYDFFNHEISSIGFFEFGRLGGPLHWSMMQQVDESIPRNMLPGF